MPADIRIDVQLVQRLYRSLYRIRRVEEESILAKGGDLPRMMAGVGAVIPAGGLGTRLRSVLPDRRKLLADVGGGLYLDKLIDFRPAAGVDRQPTSFAARITAKSPVH